LALRFSLLTAIVWVMNSAHTTGADHCEYLISAV
jgi:hypothetical protein